MRGDTAQMKARMRITTPRWKREVAFRSWDDRHKDRSFIRILSPKKDRGTGFLRVGETFWTYLPRVERTALALFEGVREAWDLSDDFFASALSWAALTIPGSLSPARLRSAWQCRHQCSRDITGGVSQALLPSPACRWAQASRMRRASRWLGVRTGRLASRCSTRSSMG